MYYKCWKPQEYFKIYFVMRVENYTNYKDSFKVSKKLTKIT